MMKTICIFLCYFSVCISACAQHTFNDSIAYTRNRTTQQAMIVLGSWAAANIATGFILAGRTSGEASYFWRMNAYWNLVNGGLAVMGYIRARRAMEEKFGLAQNEAAQLAIEKLYAFNLGLDLAYIASGFFLREKGTNEISPKTRDELRGYGTSIAVQGGFLLLMDGVMIVLHHRNTIRLNRKLHSLELGAGMNSLGISYSF